MSRTRKRTRSPSLSGQRWLACAAVVLASILFLQALSAEAAPSAMPGLGFTVTPTYTHTPTSTPTIPPPTPTTEKEVEHADPAIVKWGDPEEALPGEEVTFTIQATNKGKRAAVGVVIVDVLSEYLEILEVTTTQGTVTVEGQKVTIDVGVIGPGFVVEAVIRTRVRMDTPTPLEIENLAVLKSPNSGERISPPAIISILPPVLPKTGRPEIPWVSYAMLSGILALFAVYACKCHFTRHPS